VARDHQGKTMSDKTGIKALIVAEKIRLNDAISGYNNLMADLVSGKAVYEIFSDRAMENRVLACKSRILSLPNQMAPRLVRKTKEAIIEELKEHILEAIAQLSDLNEAELSGDVLLDPIEPAVDVKEDIHTNDNE
jgi:hypothetical protein